MTSWRRRAATCNGSRSNCPKAAFTFTVARTESPAFTQSGVTRCGRSDCPKDVYVFISERGGPIGFHPHPAHRGGRIQQRRSLVRTVRLKQDLLREPNHHERKSNQKEEARGCTVVFPVSHFRPISHFRPMARLVARSRRSIRLSVNTSMPETEPRMILPWCERSCELFRCAP